jgi:microcystin-dependent protein
MALANVALTDTFQTWVTTTNQTANLINTIVPSVNAISANAVTSGTLSVIGASAVITAANTDIKGGSLLCTSNAKFTASVTADSYSGSGASLTNVPITSNTQLSDSIVGTAEIAASAVTGGEIATGAVIAGKIGTGGVSANTQIADEIVGMEHLGTSSVGPGQLVSDAVTAGKIAVGGVSANTDLASAVITTHAMGANVGVDTLRVTGNTYMRVPVGNTALRPGDPDKGFFRYNDETSSTEIHDGSDWGNVGSGLTGSIVAYTANTVPSGYLECNGAAVNRTDFSALFAVVSDDFGNGDGSTTFNLPDLRGEFIRGWDHGATNDPDSGSRLDRGDGVTGDRIGTTQADEIESHTHIFPSVPYIMEGGTGLSDNGGSQRGQSNLNTKTLGSTGGSTETRPRNVYMMYLIKF